MLVLTVWMEWPAVVDVCTSITNSLTPWSWALHAKLPLAQLLKNFPTFYGTWRFITVFTRALHWSLSWARSIQSIPPHSLVNKNWTLSIDVIESRGMCTFMQLANGILKRELSVWAVIKFACDRYLQLYLQLFQPLTDKCRNPCVNWIMLLHHWIVTGW
jgi:hypothetical protein